jgi:hypothetical protein
MTAVVIDTNVLAVANGKADHAGIDCVMSCVSALENAKQRNVILVDSGYRIFDEYRRHANLAGQPGLGDLFLKWLWNNQANQVHCEQIEITPSATDPDGFEEFPNDTRLADFDRSDRKFVAVALASNKCPAILNATDSDWWNFQAPLQENGLEIKFLCPALFIHLPLPCP